MTNSRNLRSNDHSKIIKGAIWIILFVLVGKLAGAAKEVIIAYQYGISAQIDAYQLGITLSSWLPGTFVSVLSVILVPIFVLIRIEKKEDEQLFLRELQGNAILVGLALGLLSLIVGIFLPFLSGKLSESTQKLAIEVTIWLFPIATLTLLLGVYSARLMAQGKQINTLLECVPALTIIIFAFQNKDSPTIYPLITGTIIGTLLQTLIMWYLNRAPDAQKNLPKLSLTSRYWRELYRAFAIMAIGQVIMSIVTPLDQYYAAQIGDNAIAALGYSNRIVALLLSVGAMALSRAALPVLSELVAKGDLKSAFSISNKWAFIMLVLGTVIAILGTYFSTEIVRLLFQRGAFVSNDTQTVTGILNFALIQVPFYFSALVLVQLLASQKRYDILSGFAISNLIVKWVGNMIFIPRYGINGLALATGLMYFWSFSCLYFSTRWIISKQEC